MKRTATLVVAILALVLTACKADNSPKKQDNSAITTEETKDNNPKEGKETKMNVTEMNLEMFQQKIMDYKKSPKTWNFKGDKPAIIDFYATWCGPCKATAPVLEEVAGDYAGQIDVYKVDVDQQRELAALFGIRSIPSILFIPKTGEPTMQNGAMNKAQFEEVIKSVLLK